MYAPSNQTLKFPFYEKETKNAKTDVDVLISLSFFYDLFTK